MSVPFLLFCVPFLVLAGLSAGICGALFPEVMGLGYDTLRDLLTLRAPWTFLALLLMMKLIATSTSVGFGILGGTIGPAIFVGAVIGSLVAGLSGLLVPIDSAHTGYYALLGMGAMMVASLQAPLAALTAIVKLAHSPGVIMPGMLAIIMAALTTSQVFRRDSLFLSVLRANGLDYRANPVVGILRRSAVGGVMNTNFRRQPTVIAREAAERLMEEGLDWILIDTEDGPTLLMPGIATATYLAQEPEGDEIDLLAIPADRLELAPVHLQATLQEALDILRSRGADALYVSRPIAPDIDHIYGVLTKGRIESAYR